MTNEAMIFAIAEKCGTFSADCGCGDGIACIYNLTPNYPADHSAIHEARKSIATPAERVRYLNELRTILFRRLPKNAAGETIISDYDLLNAEAVEHAEAFLRACDLWKE